MAAVGGAVPADMSEVANKAGLPEDQHAHIYEAFTAFDTDKSGKIDESELGGALEAAGAKAKKVKVRAILAEMDKDGDKQIDFGEFCEAVMKVTESSSLGKAVLKSSGLKTLKGVTGKHSYSDDERIAFAEHLNNVFSDDAYLSGSKYFPVDTETSELFEAISDGIALCKLVNLASPETIDERTINFPKKSGKKSKLNRWEMQENQKLAINSAKAVGCKVVNLHADDLIDCVATSKEYIVLGIVWQLVRMQLLRSINVKEKPEMILLLKEGEELKDLLKLAPEKILLRWFNYHLDKGGYGKKIKNLGSDLKDSQAFLVLLGQIDASCVKEGASAIADSKERAAAVIDAARAIGAKSFIKPADIVSGNKRLILALVAQIFNTNSGLEIKKEEVEAAFEAAGLGDEDDDSSANREVRTYKQWASSFDLSSTSIGGDSTTLTDMRENIRDGVALLQLIECMQPGLVDKKKCTLKRSKLNKFKEVENCNYAVELLTKELKVNLPGIGGVDINGARANVMEAIMWQLMRLSVIKLLKELGGGKEPKDSEIVSWANKTVAASGSERKISSFRDKSIANGRFLLDLLAAIEPRAINEELVTDGSTDEEIKQNNRYVISVARKIGAGVFLTWEDIAEVKPKMVMQLIAAIMHVAKIKAAK